MIRFVIETFLCSHSASDSRNSHYRRLRGKANHDARSLEFKYASSRRKGENKRGSIDLCGDYLGYISS